MKRTWVTRGLLVVFALAFVAGSHAQTPPTLVLECAHTSDAGDNLTRGFYIPSFPAVRLDTVNLWIYSFDSDTFTVSLTARANTFDGTVLGTATATVSMDDEQAMFTFDFGGVPVQPGSTVTFAMQQEAGNGRLFFNTGTCGLGDPDCTACGGVVVETEDTSAPLSTFRRNSVGIQVYGAQEPAEPIPALGSFGTVLLTLLIMGIGVLALKFGLASGS
ncbi:MAG: hypothetical protein GXP47_13550 [Acidobacteria bacterium]|nr:hypothetical protein [Acidobacteriota bacterium]